MNCEDDFDECVSGPCQNEGTCVNLDQEYLCVCLMGFEGDMCERKVNECLIQSEDASGPCGNSGVCVDGFNSFSCNCYPDWTGEFCDQMVNYCDSSPCYVTVGKFSTFEKK